MKLVQSSGIFLAAIFVFFSGSSNAQAESEGLPLVPLPSVLDFTRGEGWGVALGVSVEFENAYDGSDEYEVEVDPAGAIQYRVGDQLLFWEGIELGWRGLFAEDWLVQLNARYEGGRDTDDSDDGRLDGLDEVDEEFIGVFEVRRSIFGEWRAWLGGRVMSGDSDYGTLGVVAAGYRFGAQLDGTGTEIFVFSTFATSDFINRDFGITAKESVSSGLQATDLDGGYRSTGLNLIDRRYITEHIQIVSQGGIEFYSSDITDSPIAREDFETEVSLSLVYHF